MEDGDKNFILSTWKKQYSWEPSVSWMGKFNFYTASAGLDKILSRNNAVMAVSPTHPNIIYGFIVYEPDRAIHYIYVKEIHRKLGIGTSLVTAAGFDVRRGTTHCTFWTKDCESLRERFDIKYTPSRLRRDNVRKGIHQRRVEAGVSR